MDQDSSPNLVTVDSEIATIVSNDDLVSQTSPLGGSVEPLVDVAIESESLFADNPLEGQIVEALSESFEPTHL